MSNELPVPNLEHLDEQLTSNQAEKQKASKNSPVEELLVWDAPNRIFDPKSAQWFLSLFAIGLVLIIFFAFIREFWLILLTAAIVFVYYALHRVEPAEIEHRVLTTGVEVGGRMYAWEDLKSFWIINNVEPAILRVETKLFLPHVLELVLPDETPQEDLDELKQLIMGYIPAIEKPHSEAGNMADDAIMTAYRVIPFKGRMTGWLGSRLNLK
jgi:hypothetical protein